jgi:hypothetical protein
MQENKSQELSWDLLVRTKRSHIWRLVASALLISILQVVSCCRDPPSNLPAL